MSKNADDLIHTDPALAALMGVSGADFGMEPEMYEGGDDFGGYNNGPDFGDDTDSAYDMDFNMMQDQSGGTYGVFGGEGSMFGYGYPQSRTMFGADAAAAPPQVRQIVAQHVQRTRHRNARALLLEPNKYSDLKVERYTFAINATITNLGTTGALTGSNSPDVNFRPQRVTTNVVSPGMVTITEGRIANVSFTVGGQIDAWQWNANAVGEHLDVPTLTPANKATFIGTYSGLVPSPLSGTGSFNFMLSFTGPASIVA
jgi:hypothetical protein